MKKALTAEVPLLTPTGKVVVSAQITYDDKEAVDDPKSEIILIYDGIEYKGNGNDFLWTDTLADLQTNLPNGFTLACCMACRHGNMCPYGNAENQLFCTKDLKISSKEDMCDLFNHTDPFEERIVAALDYCDDFVCQSDNRYTYNDYLFQLRKKATSK